MTNVSIDEYRQMIKHNVIEYHSPISYRNLQNKANGESFEELVIRACEYYKVTGAADIEKTPEPLQPISNIEGSKVIAIYTKKAQADFKGVLLGGKAVYFETKSTVNDKILQSVVTHHQTESINSKHNLGCVCFVLCAVANEYYKIPWDVWSDMKNIFNHRYMDQHDLQPYKCTVTSGIIKFLD